MGICQAEIALNDERRISMPEKDCLRKSVFVSNQELKQVLNKLFNSYDTNHDEYLDLEEI